MTNRRYHPKLFMWSSFSIECSRKEPHQNVFNNHAGKSPPSLLISPCNLSLCSAPCQPPVLLPPCTSLASVQAGRSSVPHHSVRVSGSAASAPEGIWLLHLAAAVSTVHSASGYSAAVGSCEGLDHPGTERWRRIEHFKLLQLSHVLSGLWVQLNLGQKEHFPCKAQSHSLNNLL